MNLTEMSNEFDILYNNIMSNQAPGLDEYEKSLFLTKAQNELILEYFNPKGNKFQEGFDGSERRQIDFSSLIFTTEGDAVSDADYTKKRDARSEVYALDSNNTPILLIINEFLRLKRPASGTSGNDGYIPEKNAILTVVPISYVEYARLMMKPYKLPVKSQAWRLLNSTTDTNATTSPFAELLYDKSTWSDYTDKEYIVTYIKRPSPIILINLTDQYSDVSIDDETEATECSLDPIMHHDIVQRAVELAKAAYTGDLSTQIQVGNASATNLGIVSSNSGRER